MLKPVHKDMLLEDTELRFDVYNQHGQLVVHKGTPISPQVKDYLAQESRWFRPSLVTVINHEGTHYQVPMDTRRTGEALALVGVPQSEPTLPASEEVLGCDTQHQCLAAMQEFWARVEAGKPLDEALLSIVAERLIGDINHRLDAVRYLSQLRVRDEFTYDHTLDVASVSIALALRLGLPADEVRQVGLAALLHDLGKLLIPRQIMFKRGRLTEREFDVMQLHPELGYRILRTEMGLPDALCRPALEHQEMYSGGGYPQNLRGDEIHLYSHIVKIADVYDALTSRRPYKEPISNQVAVDIMMKEGARAFHPDFLKVFVELSNYQPPDPPQPTPTP